jgi:3-methyladenine DNA glycosylase AlkC
VKITESQLRQKVKLLLKEEVYGTIATVYHGSKQPPEEFLKLFETGDGSSYASTGWLPGKGVGSTYGHGMYSVWMKTDHKTFRGDYGEWIYKLKVNLYGFIIFDETICQKVYGKSITPLEQMKLIGKEQELRKASKKELEILSTPPIKGARSAGIAQGSSNFLKSRVNGIVFFGDNDGPVVLVYDPDIATPIAWTKLDKKTKSLGHWTLWNASEIKQSLNRASHAGTHADTKRLQSQHLDVRKFINRESSFKKLYDTLSTQNKNIFAIESQNSEILTQLSKDKNVQIRRHVANNKYLPIELLIQFSKENDEGIRAAVAQNQNTPNEVFLQFVNDKKASVRSEVAKNSKVTPQILAKLARDESKNVRLAVATIRKTPTEVLTQLAGDENDRVRTGVANNPSAPTEALVQLVRDKDVSVRTGVANNPNTSAELLVQLAEDNEPWIRYYASNHKNATIEVLEKLSNDRNNKIQKSATDKLQALKQLNELKRIIKYCI